MKMTQDLKQESGILLMITIMEIIVKVMMTQKKFDTEIVRPFLCDYSDAYILVTGNIKVQNGNDATRVAINNCHPITRVTFKLNNEQLILQTI